MPSEIKVTVNRKPFFLNAKAPYPGVDKKVVYYKKFGAERFEKKVIPYMKKVGESVGIKFSYGGRMGNTMASHRLVKFADEKGKGDAMIEKIFSFYFESPVFLGDLQYVPYQSKQFPVFSEHIPVFFRKSPVFSRPSFQISSFLF